MAFLNAAGITRLVTDLKNRFAALAHTHAAATDITGQLPVANGGTGASTASGARTNLDAAQDDSSGITLASAASNISTLLATTGIASTPSGKTLQGQISTLQDSVGYISISHRWKPTTTSRSYTDASFEIPANSVACIMTQQDWSNVQPKFVGATTTLNNLANYSNYVTYGVGEPCRSVGIRYFENATTLYVAAEAASANSSGNNIVVAGFYIKLPS